MEHLKAVSNISLQASPSAFKQYQADGEGLVCGRPDITDHGIPLALLHPVFGAVEDDLQEEQLEEEDLKVAFAVCEAMSRFYKNEGDRAIALDDVLAGYLGFSWIKTGVGQTSSDGSFMVGDDLDLMVCVKELKNELCSTNADPVTQACLYHGTWYANRKPAFRNKCSCPSLLLTVAGPYMNLTGAAISEESPIYQPLTPFIPVHVASSSRMMKSVAQLLRAFKRGVTSLTEYYTALDQGADASFPYPRNLASGEAIAYTSMICPYTYQATTDSQKHVVVKFVRGYGEEAHRKCAEAGVAAPLLEVRPLPGGWFMVVYEYIVGATLDESALTPKVHCYSIVRPFFAAISSWTDHSGLQEKVECVTAAVKVLHDENLVHGDLRETNIIVSAGA
jgi:hypothetical protein